MNERVIEDTQFETLIGDVRQCTACDRMSCSQRIFGHSSGLLNARIMFIGEAPGRKGADESSIPFHGDKAGDNFEKLLDQVGLSRYDVFVTNAVLCNPRDDKGNNATPSQSEMRNCSAFLKRQLDLVDPDIVVTLGAKALDAVRLIETHNINLANGVRRAWNWYGRALIPAYHPGQRAMIHRSFLNQLSDYNYIAENYRRLKKSTKIISPNKKIHRETAQIADALICLSGSLSYFRLHKLFYLVEYEHARLKGDRLTNAYIIRQKDGPYVTDLHIRILKKSLPDLRIKTSNGSLLLSKSNQSELFDDVSTLDPELSALISGVVERNLIRSDSELKKVVYLTAPMRFLLRMEKHQGRNFLNAPVDFTRVQAA